MICTDFLISSHYVCSIYKAVSAAVDIRLELCANMFLDLFSDLGNVLIIIHVCVYGNHTFSTVV